MHRGRRSDGPHSARHAAQSRAASARQATAARPRPSAPRHVVLTGPARPTLRRVGRALGPTSASTAVALRGRKQLEGTRSTPRRGAGVAGASGAGGARGRPSRTVERSFHSAEARPSAPASPPPRTRAAQATVLCRPPPEWRPRARAAAGACECYAMLCCAMLFCAVPDRFRRLACACASAGAA